MNREEGEAILEASSMRELIKFYTTKKFTAFRKNGTSIKSTNKLKVFYRFKGNDLLIPIGFCEDLGRYLIKKGHKITASFTLKSDLEVLDKWKERYMAYNPVQYEIAGQMAKRTRAVCQVEAGAGKTEIYLGLVESYLLNHDKKVTIIVPRKLVKSEAESRIAQYEIPTDRVKFITQLGIANRTEDNNKETAQWLKETGLLIIDEVHHFNGNKSSNWILSNCDPDYLYGFSCTVTTEVINDISDYTKLNVNAMSVLSHTGKLISRSIKKNCEFYKYMSRYDGIESADYSQQLNSYYESYDFKDEIIDLLKRDLMEDRKIYIPMPFINTAQSIFERLGEKLFNTHIVLIQAGVYRIKYRGESTDKSSLSTAEVTEDFKELLKNAKGKLVLIASNVFNEGVSFKELDTAILTSSSGWKSTAQILGRSSRGLDVNTLFVNFYFKYSKYLNKQAKNRERTILTEYNVLNKPKFLNPDLSYKLYQNKENQS